MRQDVDARRLAGAHRYLAAVAYPNDPRQQGRFLEALACFAGQMMGLILPHERRWLPLRREETNRRLRKGQRQLRHALVAAHIAAAVLLEREVGMTIHRAAQDIALAIANGKERLEQQQRGKDGRTRQPAWSAATRGTDVVRSIWRPHQANVYLAMPLLMALHPKRIQIHQKRPELVALATPNNFRDLALDDRWPYEAMEVAAMWCWLLRSRGIPH